jgi:hypothetical protein
MLSAPHRANAEFRLCVHPASNSTTRSHATGAFLCRITDQRTLDGIRLLIQQMDAEKERLHGDKPRVEIIEFVSRMQS